ncbi:CLN3 domain containing protein [Nitzschia inconspicua]|uniref:CLN3 domain containing protein n=1 Tax=Nitzschia inconspicua TaxID=303405 RepID=A0A9K3M756_9STRA|nr:CLN3 domain containing protein [Nitzschia inconspicua]
MTGAVQVATTAFENEATNHFSERAPLLLLGRQRQQQQLTLRRPSPPAVQRMSNHDDSVPTVSTNRKIRYEPVSIESQVDDGPYEDNESAVQEEFSPSYTIIYASFWILGLLNNASYVIMLAAAKSISEGGTALVFLANILPALLIKSTAPYWFDHVSYQRRLQLSTASMILCFGLVASSTSLPWQLLGVAFASLQGGLGEASLLALAGKTDGVLTCNDQTGGRCLTSFSSGTGFAGVFGFFWKWFWNDWLHFTLSTTLWLAMTLAFGYWSTFQFVRQQEEVMEQNQQQLPQGEQFEQECVMSYHNENPAEDAGQKERQCNLHRETTEANHSDPLSSVQEIIDSSDSFCTAITSEDVLIETTDLTGWQRFGLVMSLWPYTVPLFTVYVAEYALQSGTWTTIGFPVSDIQSRNAFFQYSNWMYQAGVFVSRSSGTIFTAPMILLWLMPVLQVVNVAFYSYVAAGQQDHDDHVGVYSPAFLYAAALYTGLLGGAVYCHGYIRICKDLPLQYREFALSATSVAECLGIVVADIFGLVIQACLYHINGLDGAVFTCPIH